MKISQKLQLDVVSNQTKPYHTIPNLTNPNQLYIFSKQPKQIRSWWKFHRSFRWMFSQTIHNQTEPYQTNYKSSLKPPNQVRSWWNLISKLSYKTFPISSRQNFILCLIFSENQFPCSQHNAWFQYTKIQKNLNSMQYVTNKIKSWLKILKPMGLVNFQGSWFSPFWYESNFLIRRCSRAFKTKYFPPQKVGEQNF